MDPERIHEYISTLEGSHEVFTSIVNKAGFFQVVTPQLGSLLQTATIVPPDSPRVGIEEIKIDDAEIVYAYSWLRIADWALIVQKTGTSPGGFLSGFGLRVIIISLAVVVLTILIIIVRANKVVQPQIEADNTRAQLSQAAKLASVGELAAGIAHEINNPLAVITEEAGLIKDMMNPEFGRVYEPTDYIEHLDTIQQSAFRCRDIIRKLLGFVRQSEFDLQPYYVHQLIDNVVDGLLGHKMSVSNIEIVRDYARNIPSITTDGNQLEQVFLNILNNAVDAIEGKSGRITISTWRHEKTIKIAFTDTGKGMTPEQLERIFMPFFTTKEVGKGTGLGMSVSYSIIKNLGGKIEVTSVRSRGTIFTVALPLSLSE